MKRLVTFRDLIAVWPSAAALARELNLSYQCVKKWRTRNSIDPRHWPALKEVALKRGVALSDQTLLKLRNTSLERRWREAS